MADLMDGGGHGLNFGMNDISNRRGINDPTSRLHLNDPGEKNKGKDTAHTHQAETTEPAPIEVDIRHQKVTVAQNGKRRIQPFAVPRPSASASSISSASSSIPSLPSPNSSQIQVIQVKWKR
jgi:hypothetical protein